MAADNTYDALILDPDTEARLRLKQAAVSVYQFGEVHGFQDLTAGFDRLNGEKSYDVVFVSEKFPQSQVIDFIKQAKETPYGRDAAYVLVLSATEHESAKIASGVMHGADGVLMEPYSVQSLIEISQLAARVKKECAVARERAVITFLVKDIIKQIDRLAYIKACDYDVGQTLRQFREMCFVLQTFGGESRERYFEIMMDLFMNVPAPTVPSVHEYRGASQRVKRMMERKLMQHLGAAPKPQDSGENS